MSQRSRCFLFCLTRLKTSGFRGHDPDRHHNQTQSTNRNHPRCISYRQTLFPSLCVVFAFLLVVNVGPVRFVSFRFVRLSQLRWATESRIAVEDEEQRNDPRNQHSHTATLAAHHTATHTRTRNTRQHITHTHTYAIRTQRKAGQTRTHRAGMSCLSPFLPLPFFFFPSFPPRSCRWLSAVACCVVSGSGFAASGIRSNARDNKHSHHKDNSRHKRTHTHAHARDRLPSHSSRRRCVAVDSLVGRQLSRRAVRRTPKTHTQAQKQGRNTAQGHRGVSSRVLVYLVVIASRLFVLSPRCVCWRL